MRKAFVLSTGRTGTVAFTNMLKISKDVIVVHEPCPSRRFHLFGMLYVRGWIKKKLLLKVFRNARKNLGKDKRQNTYIEINPFAWAMGEVISDTYGDVKILHVVRDIRTYVISIMNFKAKGWHKHIIDYVPFWGIQFGEIVNGIGGWNRMTQYERAAWMWCLINKTIEKNSLLQEKYLRIKYEDIFSRSKKIQKESLDVIKNFLQVNLDITQAQEILENKYNESGKKNLTSFEDLNKNHREKIMKIGENLMVTYGYNI